MEKPDQVFSPAKRGDLIWALLAHPTGAFWMPGVVFSITRQGRVRSFKNSWQGITDVPATSRIVAKNKVNIDALLAAWRELDFTTFRDLDQVKDFTRRFVK